MGIEARDATLRQLTFVTLRLIGIYVVARTLFLLPQAAQLLLSGSRFDSSNLAFFIGFLLTLASGFVLWVLAGRLSEALVGKSDARVVAERSTRLMEIEVIAFSVLGVFILVSTLPFLVTNIAELLAPNTFDRFVRIQPSGNYRAAKALEVVAGLARVGIGIWLVLGSKGFVGWIRRLRDRARNIQFDEDKVDDSED